jgi:hypothetical protein
MDEKKSKTAAQLVSKIKSPKKSLKVKDLRVYVNLMTDFGFNGSTGSPTSVFSASRR